MVIVRTSTVEMLQTSGEALSSTLPNDPEVPVIPPNEGSQLTCDISTFFEAQRDSEREMDSVGPNVKTRGDSVRFNFLELSFKELELSDQACLEPILRAYPQPLTGFTFASLAAWNTSFRYAFHLNERSTQLIFSFQNPKTGERHLLQPIGHNSEEALEALLDAGQRLPYPLKIVGVSQPFLDVHPSVARDFGCEEVRESANYIYRTEDLAQLAGKRFSKKRNLIAQARKLYEWQVEPLDVSHIETCRALVRQIVREEATEIDDSLQREMAALDFTLQNFSMLGQQGTIIRVGEVLAAFSIWETNGEDMVIVHFERALRRFKGLYQVVNQETAKCIEALGIPLINREEDLGEPGLRQAKLSYQPFRLHPSLTLTLRLDASERSFY